MDDGGSFVRDLCVCERLNGVMFCFFLMIRRPPRSTLDRSSAASDVYKRQAQRRQRLRDAVDFLHLCRARNLSASGALLGHFGPVSYTHLRAHETVLDLVCRLLLEKKKTTIKYVHPRHIKTYTLWLSHITVRL